MKLESDDENRWHDQAIETKFARAGTIVLDTGKLAAAFGAEINQYCTWYAYPWEKRRSIGWRASLQ